MFSISHGNLDEMVNILVEVGADLPKEGEDGPTALHLAVKQDEREIVDYMIATLNSKGAEKNISKLYSAALCECVSASDLNPKMAKRLVA